MKNKDLKKLLKMEASKIEIPNKEEEILKEVNHQVVVTYAKPKRKFNWTPAFLSLACLVLLLTIFIIPLKPKDKVDDHDFNVSVEKEEIIISKEIVALSNIIDGLNLDDASAPKASKRARRVSLDSDDEEDEEEKPIDKAKYDKIALSVNDYLYTGQMFIKNDLAPVLEVNQDEEFKDYQYKLVIKINENNNFNLTYVSYYNEIKESDSLTTLKGIVVIKDEVFPLEGSIQKEKEEVESELKLQTGKDRFIKIENETEINENEFKYEFIENDVVVKGVSLEIENENGLEETSITITENGVETSFEFKYFDTYIECEYEQDLEVEILIEIHDTYYLYIFDNEYQVKLNK